MKVSFCVWATACEMMSILFVVGLHIDVRALAGAPGVEVDGGEPGVLAEQVPCRKDAGCHILYGVLVDITPLLHL